jgi:hypothetical protein
MVASGIGMMSLSGAAPAVLGETGAVLRGFTDYPPRVPHGLGARLLVALLVFHAGAALYDHFIRSDGLLRRMWYGGLPQSERSRSGDRGESHTAQQYRAIAYKKAWLPGLNETANYELPIPLKPAPQPTIKIRKRDRERVERILLLGGPKPSLRERAVALARERGAVRTRDLTNIGIPRCYLAQMCDEGLLIKVGYGIYRATDQEAA